MAQPAGTSRVQEDVMYAAAVPSLPPRILVEQPDGALDVGTDFARVPKDPPRRHRSLEGRSGDSGGDDDDSEAARAEQEERRLQALAYNAFLRTTVRNRRNAFLALVVVDFLFFSGVLIYQMVPKPGQSTINGFRDRSSPQANHESTIPVTWWINIPGIKLEDIIFSMVLDLLGVIGALHSRTSILSLFILLEALCTALLTLAGLSLFHVFRLVLLVAAFYLRSALMTAAALLEAAVVMPEGTAPPRTWRNSLVRPFRPMVGFAGVLFGRTGTPGRQQGAGSRADASGTGAAGAGSGPGVGGLQQDVELQTPRERGAQRGIDAGAGPSSQPPGSGVVQMTGGSQGQQAATGPAGLLPRSLTAPGPSSSSSSGAPGAVLQHSYTLPSGGSGTHAGPQHTGMQQYGSYYPTGVTPDRPQWSAHDMSNMHRQMLVMQMNQLAESAAAAAALSSSSGLRYTQPQRLAPFSAAAGPSSSTAVAPSADPPGSTAAAASSPGPGGLFSRLGVGGGSSSRRAATGSSTV